MNKYYLYEQAVQSPSVHLDWFMAWFEEQHHRPLKHLREDFCGTFKLCCEWVKRSSSYTAVGLDIDLEPLEYGLKKHLSTLTVEQKKRIWIQQQNVLLRHPIPRDLIVACNFSFCVFKLRQDLFKYFQNVFNALYPQGSLILEVAGGPGMIATSKEQKTIRLRKNKFTYIWDQKSFDPISHDAQYSIHFKVQKNNRFFKNVFSYDWRLWTIPELIDLLKEIGFHDVKVYWEPIEGDKGTGEYVCTTKGDNAYAWVAYLMAIKK